MKTPNFRIAELLASYARNPSIELRNQLVKLNTGLVRKVAYQISRQSAEPYEDLSQVGYIGLILAIERFDGRKGYAFSSFAIPYIRGEILNFIRDRSTTLKIPRRWQELYRKGKKVRGELALSLGYQPSEDGVARALGVTPQEWRECKSAAQNRFLVSLDATASKDTDNSLPLEEILADPRDRARQAWQEDRLQLQGAMSQLDRKTQDAIEFVYLRDLSRKEAAKQLGVSTITVSRHLQKGINQLALQLQTAV
ncbi:sigma-70 family RNA polymerase sigma factor [Oscillatoria sp. FACHB-1406]|uniref:sigma-70 family RNA polymerase sigma factor n=1 Tax=Oscillatoria sp. FACHB-1406 TaxID=2692846 RepID=UPI00168558CA|nr:sigma-70 family RNA polymerase sigma factor [Oscillatoria sp. FACHB-1406]MBD2578320.1 sigma-70 family RNA polymerase sigma factor [Oscillatoria sp. FACHB-1406]